MVRLPHYVVRRVRAGALFVLSGATACGLVNPNITNFDFDLPAKSFTVDASQLGLAGSSTVPFVACSMDSDCTVLAGSGSATYSCQLHGGSKDCAATVTLVNAVNLQQEAPSFVAAVQNDPVVMAQITSVKYTVSKDSLNAATPPMNLYVAPSSVMNASNPQAQLIGTVASIPAGTPVPTTDGVTFASGGQQALDPYIQNYTQPFNLLAVVTFYAGDPVPTMGSLMVTVNSRATVSISH